MPTVVLLGTLDTKGQEYAYLRDRIRAHGVETILVDVGTFEPQIAADISHAEVATAGGADIEQLAAAGDRGAAVTAMAGGAAAVLARLHVEGKVDGVIGVGGSGNSSIVTYAMRQLPVGVPKLMVSTVASGDTRPYVGAVDVTMMYSVVDIAGLNQVSARILGNAAGAIAGMASSLIPARGFGQADRRNNVRGDDSRRHARPGAARGAGYEVLVFHATGTGGQSLEALVRRRLPRRCARRDDDRAGGRARRRRPFGGPDRLEAAGEGGLPQAVSPGALDMVNFGPRETMPPQFEGRNIYATTRL